MGSQHRDPGEKWAEIQISEETVADGQYMLNQGTTKTVLGDGRLAPVGYTHWWSQSFPLWDYCLESKSKYHLDSSGI